MRIVFKVGSGKDVLLLNEVVDDLARDMRVQEGEDLACRCQEQRRRGDPRDRVEPFR